MLSVLFNNKNHSYIQSTLVASGNLCYDTAKVILVLVKKAVIMTGTWYSVRILPEKHNRRSTNCEGVEKVRTLIAFAGKYGCTKKAAHLLRDKFSGEVTLVNLTEEKPPDLDTFDLVVIGGSIYAGFIRPEVRKFCRDNLATLTGKKLGLFVCCGWKTKRRSKLNCFSP